MPAFVGLTVHLLLPQFAELGPASSALSSGLRPFMLLAVPEATERVAIDVLAGSHSGSRA